MRRPVLRVVNAISLESRSTARHVNFSRSPRRCPIYRPNSTRPRHSVSSPHAFKMRLISLSVNARRLDSAVDLSSLTRTAGLTVSNPCRTASPRQIRSTFTLKFAVERDSSFASRSRNRAMSLACSVERSRLLFASPRKPVKRSITRLYRMCVDSSVSIALASVHVSHHDLTEALGSDSMLAAVKTSLTPCAMTSRAASTLSFPLRALSAALCHARQISSACFLSLVLVERKTRLLLWVSGFQIENAQNQ